MNHSDLCKKIGERRAQVAIVGMGYVGLPLALRFADVGFNVFGIDIDASKVEALNAGRSYIKHITAARISGAVEAKKFCATTDFAVIAQADAIILCVPTPLGAHQEPDLSYVTGTLDSVIPQMRAGQLISLESTTYPGTTDEEILPRLARRGFAPGRDVFVVFSPEREDPGNPQFTTSTIPKVVGGHTAECLAVGLALYGAVVDKVVPVSSTRAAEMTKLLENIYRSVNIGLVNELKVVCERMGIDIWEVIDAAATKPFGFTPFYPGPGLGGHCIPIDPFYLTWKAREFGVHTRFIELAGEVNTSMPHYVVQRVADALNANSRSLRGARVLLVGLAYKANVDDMRESPTFVLMDLLTKRGAATGYYDPFIPVIPPSREHGHWTGTKSVEWTTASLKGFDVAIIATNHRDVDYRVLLEAVPCVIDTRNAVANLTTRSGQVWKA